MEELYAMAQMFGTNPDEFLNSSLGERMYHRIVARREDEAVLDRVTAQVFGDPIEETPPPHHHHDHDHDHDHGIEVTPELLKQYREPAMKALQEELILDQLAQDLKAEVTEEELEQEVKNMSQLLGGGNLQQIKR